MCSVGNTAANVNEFGNCMDDRNPVRVLTAMLASNVFRVTTFSSIAQICDDGDKVTKTSHFL